MRPTTPVSSAFLTITAAGFASTIAQILILRELLVLLYGNEISTGFIFFCWLLWTAFGSRMAVRRFARFSPPEILLIILLILLSIVLPFLIYMIRSAHIWLAIPTGELPSIGKVLLISISVTGLFCPISGALFSICWAFQDSFKNTGQSGKRLYIYLGEALGAALGGVLFYFLLLPCFSTLTISLLSGLLILIIAGWLLKPWYAIFNNRGIFVVWIVVTCLTVLGLYFKSDLENKSRYLQWGEQPIATLDTPYHHITLLKKENQISVFANGLWLFSEPDQLSAEFAVHTTLLQHANPRKILLLGGGISGLIGEILKHPSIERINYLEPDPDLVPFAEPFLSPDIRNELKLKPVQLFHGDPIAFLRNDNTAYDAILMNMGDPINAEMNRFYTVEFYHRISGQLLPGGIFSFAVSGGKEMMGPIQARFIRSIQETLLQVFANVVMYPGDQIRFFASNDQENLTTDVKILMDRKAKRNLDLSYIRKDSLDDMLNPFHLEYLKSLLSQFKHAAINRDFSPICYFHILRLWAFQWDPMLEQVFSTVESIHWIKLWMGLITAGLLSLLFFHTGTIRFNAAVSISVMTSGAVEIILQVVLLLIFQVLEGFVYLQLSLIIAFFMAGIGFGAGVVSRWEGQPRLGNRVISYFIRIQACFCLLPLIFILLFTMIHSELRPMFSSNTIAWLFSFLSFITGFTGGLHFSLAFLVFVKIGALSESSGGRVYALDLAGAAAGVLVATLVILPVYGLLHSLFILSAVSAISFLHLLRHP